MPKFKYSARDQHGNSVCGAIQAADRNELQRMLRTNGLFLTEASGSAVPKAASPKGSSSTGSAFAARITPTDLVIATRQLATFLRAGISLLDALEVVGSQSGKPALSSIFADIARGVSEGRSMSSEMHRYPKVFSPMLLSLVEAGEMAGTLDESLEIAATQLEREDDLRQKVKSAMMYPKMVIVACAGTIAGMVLLVVPTFAQVYKSLHSELPAPTQILIGISDVSWRYWWAFVALIFGARFAYKKYAETPDGRRQIDTVSLKIPVFGPLIRKVAISRFVQTLGGALKGGVPITSALALSAKTADNAVLRRTITECVENIRNGSQMASELERSGEFPMMVTRMIAAGEMAGNVDTMLDEINRFYETDVERAVTRMTKLIEPLMTVLVGGIVLLILLGLYMPIFNLGKAMGVSK